MHVFTHTTSWVRMRRRWEILHSMHTARIDAQPLGETLPFFTFAASFAWSLTASALPTDMECSFFCSTILKILYLAVVKTWFSSGKKKKKNVRNLRSVLFASSSLLETFPSESIGGAHQKSPRFRENRVEFVKEIKETGILLLSLH